MAISPEMLDKIQSTTLFYGKSLLFALLIFFVGKWVASILSGLAQKAILKSNSNATLASFIRNLVYCGIMTFVVIAAINKLGVSTNSFVAVIGAAGLAVGLALQGSLANFAAGVMLVLFQPFQVGHTVEAAGITGVVQEIQIFNTIFKTADNKRVIVPNAKLTADKIIVHLA